MELLHRIGVDENGLGARLGPLVVTAVLAEVDARGKRALSRRLPKAMRADLDDSKRLVSHSDFRLGEAWTRVLLGGDAPDPDTLLDRLLLEPREDLHAPCPNHVRPQCWNAAGEQFSADAALLKRIGKHRDALAERGVTLLRVHSTMVCTKRLNQAKERGVNRFVSDLHAMESLVLALRAAAGKNVLATCGKVGGMGEYGKFFGPLSHSLHTVLSEGAAESAYYFPNIGEVRFVRDADADDPLVMLASLVGKYVRELLMARIVRFYPSDPDAPSPSGYHDPVSHAFVERSALLRRERGVPDVCFERTPAGQLEALPAPPPLS